MRKALKVAVASVAVAMAAVAPSAPAQEAPAAPEASETLDAAAPAAEPAGEEGSVGKEGPAPEGDADPAPGVDPAPAKDVEPADGEQKAGEGEPGAADKPAADPAPQAGADAAPGEGSDAPAPGTDADPAPAPGTPAPGADAPAPGTDQAGGAGPAVDADPDPADPAPAPADPAPQAGVLAATATLSATYVQAGSVVSVAPVVTGAEGAVQFNYVWERDGWQSWGSDLKNGAAVSSASRDFLFLVPGIYNIFVDVYSGDQSVTVNAGQVVVVPSGWYMGASLSTKSLTPNSSLTVAADVRGVDAGLRYNFVWERDGWADWGSNLRDGYLLDTPSWTFTPTVCGTYNFYVDAVDSSGQVVRNVFAGSADVNADAWEASLTLGATTVKAGQPVTLSPSVAGCSAEGFTYNYVWNYEGAWVEWDSTVKSTHSRTDQATWDFVPSKPGRYVLAVDVVSPTGLSRCVQAQIVVEPSWDLGAVECSATHARPGQTLTVAPSLVNAPEGVKFNYVWERDGWQSWGSTVKDTGDYTDQASWEFTPAEPGSYTLFIDAVDAAGHTVTKQVGVIVWDPVGLVATPSADKSRWTVSCNLGGAPLDGFTFNYVWKRGSSEGDWASWSSTVLETGSRTSDTSHEFVFTEQDHYWLYMDVVDPAGNSCNLKTRVGYFDTGKVGYQNPANMYQVSSFNVAPHPNATGIFAYMTPSRITRDATRDDCVNAFVTRANEYIGTPYVWNYACAPGVGVDCIGLVYQCAYATGMDMGEFNPYDHYATGASGWHSHDAANVWNYGSIMRLTVEQRQFGDLIFYPGHVAIYIGDDKVIEALPARGVTISNMWVYATPLGVGRLYA